jgi:hypothetical protein
MAEYPAYREWMERNNVELRQDLEEVMAAEVGGASYRGF